MRTLLALLLLSQFATADFLEIRQVVEAGKGAKTYDDNRGVPEKLTVSDELIVGDKHLAELWPSELGTTSTNGGAPETDYGVVIKLTPEGEQRMIAATKDAKVGVARLAVIVDGKLLCAPRINSAPLGKNLSINTSSLDEAKEIAGKLRAAMQAAKSVTFEIRRVVEPGQGKLKVKLPESGEELTLADEVIVNRKGLADQYRMRSVVIGRTNITFKLTDEAASHLKEATKGVKPDKLRLAILVDGKAVEGLMRYRPLEPLEKGFVVVEEVEDAVAKEIAEKLGPAK